MVLVYAAIDIASLLALAIGVIGLAGVVFTALKFRRDDTTAVVTQQSQITAEMKTLNDELRVSTATLRAERDSLRMDVARLEGQNEELRAQVEGKVTRIERKANDG